MVRVFFAQFFAASMSAVSELYRQEVIVVLIFHLCIRYTGGNALITVSLV